MGGMGEKDTQIEWGASFDKILAWYKILRGLKLNIVNGWGGGGESVATGIFCSITF